jgi:predicted ABC-type transport system involved in lysophospholipase L1 biosynthesis ATPase subunit
MPGRAAWLRITASLAPGAAGNLGTAMATVAIQDAGGAVYTGPAGPLPADGRPTGQLDSETGQQILRLLQAVVRTEGVTALVATHDERLMDLADTVLRLDDGVLAPA